MATKSKLEQAVEKQASSLNDAQREIVLAQFSTYKRNKVRISQIEDTLSLVNMQPALMPEKAQVLLAQRASLVSERSQLVEANNEIAASLFTQLGGDNVGA